MTPKYLTRGFMLFLSEFMRKWYKAGNQRWLPSMVVSTVRLKDHGGMFQCQIILFTVLSPLIPRIIQSIKNNLMTLSDKSLYVRFGNNKYLQLLFQRFQQMTTFSCHFSWSSQHSGSNISSVLSSRTDNTDWLRLRFVHLMSACYLHFNRDSLGL